MGAGNNRRLKYFLIACNALLAVVGVVLLSLGIFSRFGATDFINKFAGDAMKSGTTLSANSSLLVNALSSSSNGSSVSPSIDFSALLDPLGTVLAAFGAALVLAALLGVLGVACDLLCCLGCHSFIIGLMIVIQIILTITVFTGTLDAQVKSRALSGLIDYYVDIDDFGSFSFTWNFVMLQFRCCGVSNFTDFKDAKRCKRTREVALFPGKEFEVDLTTPIACCKFEGQLPNIDVKDKLCVIFPTSLNSNWMTGCWKEVKTSLSAYRPLFIALVASLIIFESLFFVIAVVLLCGVDNAMVDVT